MKKILLLFALCGMVAVGCTEGGENKIPDEAYITLNKEVLTFVPDGESVEVKVYSNYEWTLTNNCDWVTASISGGEASEEGTTITLTANIAYDNREDTIIFNCGEAKKVLVVSQGLKEVIISDENNTFNLPVEGGTVDIAYQTTVECEVVIPSDAQHWISLAPETRGLESGCATLNIAKSKAGADRRAVVKVVKMGDQSVFAEYTITQERNMDYIIFYTTTNGETISPYSFDYLTNTYEDGVGMLAFDGSIVTSIGYRAFYDCDSLTSITISDRVTSIEKEAFYGCASLTSITIPDRVNSIASSTFRHCTSLTSATIGNNVTSIGSYAFSDCTSLTSVTIPDGAIKIGSYAFYNCTSLTSITIPDIVTSIGDSVFSGCTSLTSVTIPDSVTSIGNYAFNGCTGELIINSSKIIETDYDNRPSNNGWLAGAEFTKLTIGDSITSIGDYAFSGCKSLTSITIPDSVTSIGNDAFRICTSLTSVTIPDSVTSIGDYAFSGCKSLTSVTIGKGFTEIGRYAFDGCTGELTVNCNIPSASSYNYGAFFGSNFTKVTIGDSVTLIGYSTFYYCTSLKDVYCKPTTPPVGGLLMFDVNASGRKIYVPRDSVEAYKSASYWGEYAEDIEGYDF